MGQAQSLGSPVFLPRRKRLFRGGAVSGQAQFVLATVYDAAADLATIQSWAVRNFRGSPVAGVNFFPTTAWLSGTLTVDEMGDEGALFVFQIGYTLTTGSGSSVMTINGRPASGNSVFREVGSSATLAADTAFEGHIPAITSITLSTDASIGNGSALAQGGAVTLSSTFAPFGGCVLKST